MCLRLVKDAAVYRSITVTIHQVGSTNTTIRQDLISLGSSSNAYNSLNSCEKGSYDKGIANDCMEIRA